MTLFLLMLASFAMTSQRAGDQYRTGEERSSLDHRCRRAMAQMVRELREAGAGSLAPSPAAPFGSSQLQYLRITGYTGGAAQWGETRRLELSLDTGELDDGVDNDGDGLVDERQLTWIENPGPDETRTVWLRGIRELAAGETANGADDNGNGLIDEPGLSFELTGDVLRIRLTVEKRASSGELMSSTAESAVRLRN